MNHFRSLDRMVLLIFLSLVDCIVMLIPHQGVQPKCGDELPRVVADENVGELWERGEHAVRGHPLPAEAIHGDTLISLPGGKYSVDVVYFDPLKSPFDINLATVEELQLLPGIGPALAERIVAARPSPGAASDGAWLERVPGIGKNRLEQLELHSLRTRCD